LHCEIQASILIFAIEKKDVVVKIKLYMAIVSALFCACVIGMEREQPHVFHDVMRERPYMFHDGTDDSAIELTAKPVDLAVVANEIEKKKAHLLGVLNAWNCGKQEKIIDLERALAELQVQQREIEKKLPTILPQEKPEDGTRLDLPHKKIATLYGFLKYKDWWQNITELIVPRNKLTTLPLGYLAHACPGLEKLNVAHNRLSYIAYTDDTYTVPVLYSLKKLSLKNNQLSVFDFDACFTMFPNIAKLDLSKNPMVTFKWKQFPGWSHENAEETPWPIIDITGNQLDIDELFKKYALINIQWYARQPTRRSSLLTLVAVPSVGALVGGALGIGAAVARTHLSTDPILRETWLIAAPLIGGAIGGAVGGCTIPFCIAANHTERLTAMRIARDNIINGDSEK
jgi:hypothetical protein